MIRSSKLSLKFSNTEKLQKLHQFIDEYKSVVKFFVDQTWELDKVPCLLPKELTSKVKTWLTARAIQCAAKQASAIVRGTKTKQNRRLYVYNKLLKENRVRQAKRLKKIIDKVQMTKPNLDQINPELDARFIKMDFDNITSFDGWITFGSLGQKLKLEIPVKKTKHFNSLDGKVKAGIRLSKKQITFMFESEIEPKTSGETVGLDMGLSTVASLSDDQVTKSDVHNHDFSSISKKLSRKKKGSNAFRKAQTHRTNFVNWSVNQLNFNHVNHLKLEDLKDVRRNKRSSRYLNHWTYTEIQGKLVQTCEELGVLVSYVSPTYTSQRCSSCGWVRKSNRKGKLFKCGKCCFVLDADLNASRNIALDLPAISRKKRLQQDNRKGFYWNVVGQEPIVPVT